MTLDERIEALVLSIESSSRDVETLTTRIAALRATVEVDAANIQILVRIAESRER
jgi:hypothetical protein